MNVKLTAAEVLARVKTLPALPDAVHALNEALRSESTQTDSIVRAISTDQALTVAALRLANSSFYGVSRRVVTLRDAVQILGIHTLSAAVMTAAVMSRFDRTSCPGFDFDANWRHAFATALCAQKLAQARDANGDAAYTAGLLHDIGRLVLASCFPNELAATLAWAFEHDAVPLDAEREVLGIDHAEVGAALAEHWKLAPSVVSAIRSHHDLASPESSTVLDALHMADNIVHALDLSHLPQEIVPPMSPAVWERMNPSGTELQELFSHIEQSMQDFAGLTAR